MFYSCIINQQIYIYKYVFVGLSYKCKIAYHILFCNELRNAYKILVGNLKLKGRNVKWDKNVKFF